MKLFFEAWPVQRDTTPGYGTLPAEYVFVGAAPALSHKDQTPFRQASMRFIDQLVTRLGGTYYATNLVKTKHNLTRKVPRGTVRKWYPSTKLELQLAGPRRIIALGIEAAETLCPGFQTMQEDHGTLFWNPDFNCYVTPAQTFHRAMTARDPRVKAEFIRDLARGLTLPDPVPPKIHYLSEATPPEIPKNKRAWLDIETTGLELTDEITRIGLTWKGKKDEVWEYVDPTVMEMRDLRERLLAANTTVIGHNLQFDLTRLSWKSRKDWLLPVEDTLVRAHVMGERGVEDKTGSLSLKHLTSKYTDRPGPHAYGHAFSSGSALDLYLSEDVLSTRALWNVQEQKLAESHPWILNLLNRLLPHMVAMQIRGVYVDRPLLASIESVYSANVSKILKQLAKYGADINWDATAQVAELLLAKGVPLKDKTDGGAYSVAEAALLPFKDSHRVVRLVLDYRAATKDLQFLQSYLALTTPEDPYLRPRLILTSTETGRLSCRGPNLQQVPRIGPIKTVFKSRHVGGKIALCDLSQAELRVIALLSGDKLLLDALLSEDVHRTIASMVFELPPAEISSAQRKKSKGVTFGLVYGGGDEGLAERVGVPTKEVTEVKAKIFAVFKGMNDWISGQHKIAAETGRSTTVFGRVRDLTALIRAEGFNSANRKATNTPVQSIASDCDLVLLYFITVACIEMGLKTRPVLGVHDSLIFDVYPGEERKLAELMLEAFQALGETPLNKLDLWGQLPLAGELVIGESWSACESTNEGFKPERVYPVDSRETTTLVSDDDARVLAIRAIEEKAS